LLPSSEPDWLEKVRRGITSVNLNPINGTPFSSSLGGIGAFVKFILTYQMNFQATVDTPHGGVIALQIDFLPKNKKSICLTAQKNIQSGFKCVEED